MELNQTSICYYEKKLAHISAATESADSIVPDTFPDIGRNRVRVWYGGHQGPDSTE